MPHQCGMHSTRLSPHDERVVAVRAGVDPRTVRAYLEGRSQRSTVAARVAVALRDHGFVVDAAREEQRTP